VNTLKELMSSIDYLYLGKPKETGDGGVIVEGP
jgi:hypothetical protein